MALLSMDMIREIQGVAEHYAKRERERLARASQSATKAAAANAKKAEPPKAE